MLLDITTFKSRKVAGGYTRKGLSWRTVINMLSSREGVDTYEEYMRLSTDAQDDLKDIGGYVLGVFRESKRQSSKLLYRTGVAYDVDNISPADLEGLMIDLSMSGYAAYLHSTRKHTADAPRVRILLPLAEQVSADQYEPMARKLAEELGLLDIADPTTYEPSRLMFLPSHCRGEVPLAVEYAGSVVNPETYLDWEWHDVGNWPRGANEAERLEARLGRAMQRLQAKPNDKTGTIGAFCRAFTVPQVIDNLLADKYVPAGEGRYTYTGGSTTGGAVLYDGDMFLYSHHATDPAGGRLCNAFDLARIHLYGTEDNGTTEGTYQHQPSIKRMIELANGMPEVIMEREKEWGQRRASYARDFAGMDSPSEEAQAEEWLLALDRERKTGAIKATIGNVRMIMEHDRMLSRNIWTDVRRGRVIATSGLPWRRAGLTGPWTDVDKANLQAYLEAAYGIAHRENIKAGFTVVSAKDSRDPVKDYLDALPEWDGEERADTLFVRVLGAADTPYTRGVTRAALIGAVARVYDPGCKHDCMLTLVGPQNLGKSTSLFRLTRRRPEWFLDDLEDFEGKEYQEKIQGPWIVELAEMRAVRGQDQKRVKQVLSSVQDSFRKAYGEFTEDKPRRVAFFGTGNTRGYLSDRTGNRRHWPLDVGVCEHEKAWDVMTDDYVDQLWAEVVTMYNQGSSWVLPASLHEALEQQHKEHMELGHIDSLTGLIIEHLKRPVPTNWDTLSREAREMWWQAPDADAVPRTVVCALDIWVELLGGSKGSLDPRKMGDINRVMERMEGWERAEITGPYGRQEGFRLTAS